MSDDLDPRLVDLMRRFFDLSGEIVEGARALGYSRLASEVSRATARGITPAGIAATYLVLDEHEDELAIVVASSPTISAAFDAIETLGSRACRDRAIENRN